METVVVPEIEVIESRITNTIRVTTQTTTGHRLVWRIVPSVHTLDWTVRDAAGTTLFRASSRERSIEIATRLAERARAEEAEHVSLARLP